MRIRARRIFRKSGEVVVPTPEPGEVTGLTEVGLTSTSVSLVWEEADGATSYLLEYRVQGESEWTQQSLPLDNAYTLHGLTPEETYEFRVSGVNGNGTGVASNVVTSTLPAAPTGSAFTYDESMGLGVVDGRTNLPLHPDDRRIWVNNTMPNDDGDGLTPETAKKTFHEGAWMLRADRGDQLMIAAGTPYPERFQFYLSSTARNNYLSTGTLAGNVSQNIRNLRGRSLEYPMVIQSYDPADPLNEDLYGEVRAEIMTAPTSASASSSSAGWVSMTAGGQASRQRYIAIRGFYVNPPVTGTSRSAGFNGGCDGLLIENCIVLHQKMAFNPQGAYGKGVSFTGTMEPGGTTLTVTAISNAGTVGIVPYLKVVHSSGSSVVTTDHYIASQLTGTTGGIGTYAVDVAFPVGQQQSPTGTLTLASVFHPAIPFENNARGLILRRNAMAYATAGSDHTDNAYVYNWQDGTLEDCFLYHGGWGYGETRASKSSGAMVRSHNIYCDSEGTTNWVMRRNISADAAATGLMLRCGGLMENNVSLSNPIGLQFGGGDLITSSRPFGAWGEFRGNVVLGSQDCMPGTARGFGVSFNNTRALGDGDSTGTFCYDNIIANVSDEATGNIFSRYLNTDYELPIKTHVEFDDNIVYDWGSKQVQVSGITADTTWTETNSELDIAAAGSNVDSRLISYPDPTRSLVSYLASIGVTVANRQTGLEHILANWGDPLLHSEPLRLYVREGFGR